MDLKADTMVTIQVDLNMGWYAHDFLCASQEGMGSDAGGGGVTYEVKARIPGEATYPE